MATTNHHTNGGDKKNMFTRINIYTKTNTIQWNHHQLVLFEEAEADEVKADKDAGLSMPIIQPNLSVNCCTT